MSNSQKRAVANYRDRLVMRGLSRFEVLGVPEDKDLLRNLAKWLVEHSAEATSVRASIRRTIEGSGAQKGGIYAALRRSPLVGADVDLTRELAHERDVDL